MPTLEKLAGLIPDLNAAYMSLKDSPEFTEIILYSTCNRVELLCAAPEAEPAAAPAAATGVSTTSSFGATMLTII